MAATTVATSAPASIGLRRLLSNSDVILAIAVVAIVAMMIIPLPAWLLDILIALNMGLAVTVMLVSLYLREPLDFSVFPSLLLILTLYRLSLNISATRLILLYAHAGSVITAFGQFVVGGNYVVGIVIFLILMIIQFIVITSGAGRVAEVAARFTLDAMPGKQMSIDADLNAGLIDEQEAKTRRRKIQKEADFYGAMDGASKFVRGDAVAAVAIVAVNIIGGFAIGALQLGMSLTQALQTYTLLTVGEGLVSQIPALLISTATGIIVTRTAAEENMGSDVLRQLTANPRALAIVAGLMVGFGLVPGLPKLPFMIMAAAIGGVAWVLQREKKVARERQAEVEAAPAAPALIEPEAVAQLLTVDTLEVEIGYGLIPLVEAGAGTGLLNRISMIRRQVAMELGFILPKIRIRDNLQLPPNVYAIKLRGEEIGQGSLVPGQYLAMATGPVAEELPGLATSEPAFGLPARWIEGTERERAEMIGYTVVDPASVVSTHLTEVIKGHAAEILTRQDTRDLLDHLKKDYPALVEDLVPNPLSLSDVHEVLRNLLRERVSIRDLVTILETASGLAQGGARDADLLSEGARRALARAISNQYRSGDGSVHVVTLSPGVERLISDAMGDASRGLVANLDPRLAQRLLETTAQNMEEMAARGYPPVVLCSAAIRLAFKRLTERVLSSLAVLSYAEIAPGINVIAEGMIDLPSGAG